MNATNHGLIVGGLIAVGHRTASNRHAWLGPLSITLGLPCALGRLLCAWRSWRLAPPDLRAHGFAGLDPDGALCRRISASRCGLFPSGLIGSAAGTALTILTDWRPRRLPHRRNLPERAQ